MNFLDLNVAMKRSHHPMKTVDEVASRLEGANTFSILDAKNGFWQLKLDEESPLLCTFNTPIGRYRFTRLPFGVKCAPEICQRTMDRMVEDLDGVEVIMDDVIVAGDETTSNQHYKQSARDETTSNQHYKQSAANRCRRFRCDFRRRFLTCVDTT
jgi:hypothetical protein